MADQPQSGQGFAVKVAVNSSIPLPPPEAANFFHLMGAGTEVQLLVGSVSLLEVLEVRSRGGEGTVAPQITHRFILSSLAFEQLRAQVMTIPRLSVTGVADASGRAPGDKR
jgi:hypothetical protein